MKPVLFVTGHAPAFRVGAFARLHEREQIELALFGGRSKHGGAHHEGELPFPHRHVRPSELYALARSGRYRAVVCPTGGRVAPLATWVGARGAGVPLILWASLWAHPRTAAHTFTYLPLLGLYRSADAVVTYGPHVSAYVQAHGASKVFVAPQAVDNGFWGSPNVQSPSDPRWPRDARTVFLFVGRAHREKGVKVLLDAWQRSRLSSRETALVLVGFGADADLPEGALGLDQLAPQELRDAYAAADVLVAPSIRTATFREPWGLVVNEAMNRRLAVIASDEVGAAAGGLVQDGVDGLVVPAGDSAALADALTRLGGDEQLRARMGQAGRERVAGYTYDAWADGFSQALASLGVAL